LGIGGDFLPALVTKRRGQYFRSVLSLSENITLSTSKPVIDPDFQGSIIGRAQRPESEKQGSNKGLWVEYPSAQSPIHPWQEGRRQSGRVTTVVTIIK
jgi:hypothetical protein